MGLLLLRLEWPKEDVPKVPSKMAIWAPGPLAIATPGVLGTNRAWRKDSPSFLWPAGSPFSGDRVRRDGAFRALSVLGPSCSFRGIITASSSQLGASSCFSTMSQSCRGGEEKACQEERPPGLHYLQETDRRKGQEMTLK